MSTVAFVIEFEQLYNKIKAHDVVLPNGILTYEFLNNHFISSPYKK